MYTEDLDPRILAHVDEVRNCEDLAMPMLVAHHTRLPPVTVDAPGMEHLQVTAASPHGETTTPRSPALTLCPLPCVHNTGPEQEEPPPWLEYDAGAL